jgi:hypothetical protein
VTQKLVEAAFEIVNFVFETSFDASNNLILVLILSVCFFVMVNLLRLKHGPKIRRCHSLSEASKEFIDIIKVISLLIILVILNWRSYSVNVLLALNKSRKYLIASLVYWRNFSIALCLEIYGFLRLNSSILRKE